MFINNVLLEQSNVSSFLYCLQLLSCYSGRGEFWQRPHGSQSLKYLLFGPLQNHVQKIMSNFFFSLEILPIGPLPSSTDLTLNFC